MYTKTIGNYLYLVATFVVTKSGKLNQFIDRISTKHITNQV